MLDLHVDCRPKLSPIKWISVLRWTHSFDLTIFCKVLLTSHQLESLTFRRKFHNILSLERRERPRFGDAVCLSLCQGIVSRLGDSLKRRFSWFPVWISKVQNSKRTDRVDLKMLQNEYLLARHRLRYSRERDIENKPSKIWQTFEFKFGKTC